MIKTIINRDGTKAKFELWRVETAIEKALHSCTGKDNHLAEELTSGNSIPSLSKNLASEVYSELKEYLPGRIITVELVQNTVERILMKKGYYVVAKEYILYRDRHARIRKQFLCTESVGQINVMSVIKRSNEVQPMSRDKILKRIRRECEEHSPILKCDPVVVAERVAEGVYDGVTTRELDELTITIAKNMVIQHPDYEKLAARIAISGHQKDTDYHRHRSIPGIDTQIAFVVWSLFHNTDQNGDHSPLLQKELYEYILENQSLIDEHIDYERDFSLSIFGFQTLTRAYLMKALTPDFPERGIVERPQDMFMRVALGIHCVKPNKFVHPSQKFSDYERRTGELIDDFSIASCMVKARDEFVPDLDQAFQTYSYMSKGYFIHATPTLFYSGTPRPGLSSCFLLAMDSDSIRGIYKTLSDCALISKNAGGIGVHIHKIRANQSYIRGTAGKSNGIVPMLKVYNDTAKYVDQCFAPGTIVHTVDGPKNIEDIEVKDELLTSEGNFKPVERVLEHDYDGEILKVSVKYGIKDVLVTPEHQVLALQKQAKGPNYSVIRNRLDKGYAKAEMIDAKELLVDDFVCFPLPKVDTVDHPTLDLDDLRFYGLLIGDGWICKDGRNAGLSFGTDERKEEVREFVENYFERLGIHITVSLREESHNIRYQWSANNPAFKFTRDQLYDENDEKIIWRPFFKLPLDKLMAILQGIFEADGSILKECVLEMTSKNVIDGVRYILLRSGILSGGYVRDRRGSVSSYKNITTKKITYALRIPRVSKIAELFPRSPKGKWVNYLIHDGKMYCRVTAISKEHYSGKVYDFEVAEEHTYVTELGACHNGGGKRKGAFACFCKDTEVMTVNEGVKKIQEVKLGDLVVTHKNRIRHVIQLHENPLGDRKIYKLIVEKNKEIYVTGNHRFWSFYTKKYRHKPTSLGWNSVDRLKDILDNKETTRTACYISIPLGSGIVDSKCRKINVMDYRDDIIKEENQELRSEEGKISRVMTVIDRSGKLNISKTQPVNSEWVITEDLANLFGIWLGDGYIRKRTKQGTPLGIGITVHKENMEEIAFINRVCEEAFGCRITKHTLEDRKVTNITVNSAIVGTIFYKLFGGYSVHKKLPNRIFGWPKPLIESLMAGLITSDGHISKEGNVSLGLSNKYLMNQLYHLCRNNGIAVSFVKGKIGKGMNAVPYTMSIPLNKNILDQTRKLYTDNRVDECMRKINHNRIANRNFLKIIDIEETDRSDEYVYTLGVEEDHSYNVEGLLAENCYMACWHADILDFLELKLPQGQEHLRSRDLFYAFWRNDYFMECVLENRDWYLMCPDECPGLAEVYGEDFVRLYEGYVEEGKYRKVVKAREVYQAVIKSRVECGVPYIGEKDSINRKSNQSNLGVIQSSNLCVSGDTYILTKEFGQIPIEKIVDKWVEVWNGEEWSKTAIRQTGKNKDLLKVTFSNGVVLNCTPEHRFYLKYRDRHRYVEARSLKPGDVLIDYKLPSYGSVIPNPYLETETRLALDNNDLESLFKLLRLQLQTHGIDASASEKGLFLLDKERYDIRVISVEEGYKGVNTYCFTEHKRHMGMFNGILTGQCTEISLYSDPCETAVCNLASIALPRFVEYDDAESPYYDYRRLHEVAQIVTRNINKVIDRNYYPTPESERSNYRHRPIGLGVQGLWDVFMMFRLPFGSPEAIKLDKTIFETIYHGALTASLELAKEEGPYSSFWYNGGCPLSKGLFQFDLWAGGDKHSGMWDWEDLRSKIMKIGIRNSELIAPMPTASTSQILGWTECFEPIKSNLYKRKTSSGEFIILNKYLYKDIEKLGLDVAYIREQIEANGGSVQKIEELPIELKELYKTVWDMDQTLIVDHCASRSPYVSQCCSMNLYFDVVDPEILMKVDIYSWMKGIKTQYYTHSRSLTKAKQHHSSDNKNLKENSEKEIVIEGPVCRMEEGCLMCGS